MRLKGNAASMLYDYFRECKYNCVGCQFYEPEYRLIYPIGIFYSTDYWHIWAKNKCKEHSSILYKLIYECYIKKKAIANMIGCWCLQNFYFFHSLFIGFSGLPWQNTFDLTRLFRLFRLIVLRKDKRSKLLTRNIFTGMEPFPTSKPN